MHTPAKLIIALSVLALSACGAGSLASTSVPPTTSGPASTAVPPTTTVISAAPASAGPTTTAAVASTADVERDLAQIDSDLSAAGQDLQLGPTEQTIDPRG